jgi:hypothetical protein
MNVRISESRHDELRRFTAPSFMDSVVCPMETGCLLLVSRNSHPLRQDVLVCDILFPEEGDLECAVEGLVFTTGYLRRAMFSARERGLDGFLTVHTHPRTDSHVGFSEYDDFNDPFLMANLYELMPSGCFGSVVLGRSSAAARIWNPETTSYVVPKELIIVGQRLSWLRLDGGSSNAALAAEIFDRGLAVTGSGALLRLSTMRVGVVGASGTGSLVAELLLRAGVCEIVIFDFDRIEIVNLNRILHSRNRDAMRRRGKGERIAEAIAETDIGTTVTVIPEGDICEERVAFELRGCDFVFGCVDRDWPRLILSEFSQQFLVPCIDVGTEIGITDVVQSLDSRVSYIAPGRPCLVCSRIVSLERVRLESMNDVERARVISMGYSEGPQISAPAVMDLNMRAASYGSLVLRHVLQPFLNEPLPTHIKESLTNYNTRAVQFESRSDCPICGGRRREGIGDSVCLSTRDASSRRHFTL